ncbi:MAG: hypothetical protein AAFP89_13445, partial [Bacteroidota bacterium]
MNKKHVTLYDKSQPLIGMLRFIYWTLDEKRMKTIFLIIAIFTSHALISQNCYQNVNPKDYPKDFSQLWLEKTFQGTIGDQNQRIEFRFTSVTQS